MTAEIATSLIIKLLFFISSINYVFSNDSPLLNNSSPRIELERTTAAITSDKKKTPKLASHPAASSAEAIAAWVISLERTPHRYNVFKSNSFAHQVFPRLELFPATDGNKIDVRADSRISAYGRASIVRGERRSHSGLATRGMAGLYVSHVEVWKTFLESGENLGIVFEDDAMVESNAAIAFDEVLASLPLDPEDWDVDLWLLGVVAVLEERPASRLFATPGWIRVTNFFGTQAYLLTKRGARRLIENAYPMTEQIDAYMARMSALGEIVTVYRSDKKVDYPQFAFGQLQGVWSTVQQSYCGTCSLPPNWNRAHDEAGWRRFGATIGAILALTPWGALYAAVCAACLRLPKCKTILCCCCGCLSGGGGGGSGSSNSWSNQITDVSTINSSSYGARDRKMSEHRMGAASSRTRAGSDRIMPSLN